MIQDWAIMETSMTRKGCCFRVWEVERNAVSMEHPMSNVANVIPNNPPNIQVSLMIAVPLCLSSFTRSCNGPVGGKVPLLVFRLQRLTQKKQWDGANPAYLPIQQLCAWMIWKFVKVVRGNDLASKALDFRETFLRRNCNLLSTLRRTL